MEEQTKNITTKQKILKTIYYLTFIPYIAFVICTIYSMIFGVTFMFSTCYGLEALEVMIIILGIFTGIIPIFPVCLIYQIVFKILTKKHQEYKQYNFKRFVVITFIITVIALAGFELYKATAHSMWKNTFYNMGVDDIKVAVVPYNESYDNIIGSLKLFGIEDVEHFIMEHYEDLIEYYDYFIRHYNDFALIVSPVIDGEVISYEDPKIEYSEGKGKIRANVTYTVDKSSSDKYLIIYILDDLSYYGNYEESDISIKFKEKH